MSIPYRFPNGSYGRIMIAPGGFRESMAHLSFREDSDLIEEKYAKVIEDCNCQLLTVSDNYISYFSEVTDVSKYLYGITAEELCTPNDPEARYSSYPEMIEWNNDKVSSMNWDMFLLAFYLFVFSDSDFSSFYWRQLQQILRIIENDNNLFKRVTFGKTKNFNEDVNIFWNKIYEELGKKVLRMCSAQTCWLAFQGLKEIQETFSIAEHTQCIELEKMFCMLMDGIAVEKFRRDDRDKIRYLTIDSLDINNIFFYDEYFELESVDPETKEEVFNMAFERFLWAADLLRDNNQNYISADTLYEKALDYANAEQRLLIDSRRKAIMPYIQKQEEIKRKEKRKDDNRKIAETITIPAVSIAVLALVVFIILTIISLIFSLEKLFDVSWVGAVISTAIGIISYLTLKIFDPDLKLF